MIERHKIWQAPMGAFGRGRGPLGRVYMDDAMLDSAFGAPSGYEPEVLAYSSASGVTDGNLIGPLDVYVKALKNAGLWTKFSVIYPFMGATADSTKWNLVDTATFPIYWNGGMTYASTHINSNGTTGYGDTGFKPLPNMTSDSHVSFYIRDNLAANGNAFFGCQQLLGGIVGNQIIYPKSGDGKMYTYYNNTASQTTSFNYGTSVGYFITVKDTTTYRLARNGTVDSTGGTASGDRPNKNMLLCACQLDSSIAGYHANQYGFFTMGRGLNASQISTVNTITQALFTAISR